MTQLSYYTCNDCGNTFEWERLFLIYRKDGEIVENECLMFTSIEYDESDLRGKALLTYCDNCEKNVKIYTVDEWYSEEDKKRFGGEIKEYMKHKKHRNTIKTFIEEVDDENISCPNCDRKLSLEYTRIKCPKCGSENNNVYDTLSI